MFGLPLPVIGLSLIFAVAMCVHVVRTHQAMYWLWIILMFQPLGGLVYFVAIVMPGLMGGPTARRMGGAAREALDPGRDWRRAKAAYDDSPTVQNGMKLAEATAAMGRWAEADKLYAEALQGHYADDPALLLGRARALLELNKPAEALELIGKIAVHGDPKAGSVTLARARALHGLGRNAEAEREFNLACERAPGLEAMARQAAFLADIGKTAEAKQLLAEIDRRVDKTRAQFRREARQWRDYAAEKVAA